MKISQLPEPVRSKALEYQRNANMIYWDRDTDIVGNAFDWYETTEEYDYWIEWELATEVTPELLKMHYEDAEEVRCLYDDRIYNITSFIEYNEHHNDICSGIKGFDIGNVDYINSYACLYVIETNQLAEIISYKKDFPKGGVHSEVEEKIIPDGLEENLKNEVNKLNHNEIKMRFDGSVNTQPHYDNTHGSLYKVAEQRNWNTYQFDIVKRIDRALKKGQFKEDLQKTKDLIDLWLSETK